MQCGIQVQKEVWRMSSSKRSNANTKLIVTKNRDLEEVYGIVHGQRRTARSVARASDLWLGGFNAIYPSTSFGSIIVRDLRPGFLWKWKFRFHNANTHTHPDAHTAPAPATNEFFKG